MDGKIRILSRKWLWKWEIWRFKFLMKPKLPSVSCFLLKIPIFLLQLPTEFYFFCEKCIKIWLFDVSQSAAIHQELSALGLKTSILSLPSKFCLPGPLHQDIKLMLKSSSLHQDIRRTQNVAVAAHVVVVAALKYFLLKCSFLNHSCFISFTMPVPTLPIFCRNKFHHELNMLNHVSHWKNNGSLRKNLKRSTTGCKSWSWNLLSFFGRFLGQRITGAGGRRNLWLFEQ